MMKRLALLWVIIEMTMTLGFCQTNHDIKIDTLSYIKLTDDRGVNYKIIQMVNLVDNHWVDSTRTLVIFYDTNKAILHLPTPDEEVKNFSIKGISNNENGITLITSQGGGPCIVQHHFIFVVEYGQLYLNKIISEFGGFGSKESETDIKTFHPNIRIDEIKLITFL